MSTSNIEATIQTYRVASTAGAPERHGRVHER
jgi:hypothetical protein